MGVCIVGQDPELMIIEKSSGNLVSAIPLIKGSKHHPQAVDGGAILSDNVCLEYNTRPGSSSKELIDITRHVLKQTLSILGSKHKLVVRASATFPKEQLNHPEATEIGCSADFDAWEMSINSVDQKDFIKGFRSAGGHIHIGATEEESSKALLHDDMGKIRVVKAMDVIAGIISVIIDNDPTSMARRKLYGKAGCHRPKDYGVEYRSLGNFWVASPILVDLIFDLTSFAVELCLKDEEQKLIDMIGEKKIQEIINDSMKSEALKVYEQVIIKVLPKKIIEKINKVKEVESYDFYKSWSL